MHVHFHWVVHCMLYELYLNKVIIFKKGKDPDIGANLNSGRAKVECLNNKINNDSIEL